MKITSRNILLSFLLALSIVLTACSSAATPTAAPVTQAPATEAPAVLPPETPVPAPTTPANPNLILATTSTQDSGLLDVLVPMFQEQTGYTVQTVAVGSGQAMTMGQEGNKTLLNVYHVITVNPEKWEKVNYDGATAFLQFMTDPATQEIIAQFGVEKFGQPLFFPDADKTDADLGL